MFPFMRKVSEEVSDMQIISKKQMPIMVPFPSDWEQLDIIFIEGCRNPKYKSFIENCYTNLLMPCRYNQRKEIFSLEDEYKEFCQECMKCVCPVLGDEAQCIGNECKYLKSCHLVWDH